jgi:DNA processing protein
MIDEFRSKIILNLIPEIGPVRANRLIAQFGSAGSALNAGVRELGTVDGISRDLAGKIAGALRTIDVENELQLAKKHGIKITTLGDDSYPVQLTNIPDPPAVLYYKGSLTANDIFSVAVVGTRRPTSYGKIAAEKLVKDLAQMRVTVISGLARGIDTFSHRAALKSGGRTLAVLGNGLATCYPPENRGLAAEIEGSGALVSEFPVTYPPDKPNFPRRNRLIAGLSLGTLVVEGDLKSGALITARCALEQGKDVFAVPGSILSQYSAGPHSLLKQGAKLVESAEDIVEELSGLAGWIAKNSAKKTGPKELPLLNPSEQEILLKLEKEPQGIHIDSLQSASSKSFGELSQILVSLELKNLIKSLPGKIYIKI